MNTGLVVKFSGLYSKYLSPKIVFLIDITLMLLASVTTCLLANYVSNPLTYRLKVFLVWIFFSALWSTVFLILFGIPKKLIRHTSYEDILAIAAVCVCKALMMSLSIVVFSSASLNIAGHDMNFNLSPYLWIAMCVDGLVSFFLMSFIRMSMVAAYIGFNRTAKTGDDFRNVLVYGLGEKSVAMDIRLRKSHHYKMLGYITANGSCDHSRINGLPVYYVDSPQRLKQLRARKKFDSILFVTDAELNNEKDGMVQYATDMGIKILVAPSIDEAADGVSLPGRFREVKIEDLLGREEITVSMEGIKNYFSGKTVLVTGAAGSIGSELCRQLAGFGVRRLVLFDNAETPMHNIRLEFEETFPDLEFYPVIGDIRSRERVDYAFRKWRPDVVFHAGAYKHVPLMEENPCEAVRVNLFGTRNVADKCLEYDVEKMVMISTDKAVNPTNIMGCSKRLAEIYVQSLGTAVEKGQHKGKTKFVTTRFGNVLGSNGSVIPRFRQQIAAGGPVTVTHPDITRFFMTIPEACRLVMEAATMSDGNQIFVFDMGKSVKIDDMARKMIRLAGFVPDEDIKIEYTGLRPGEKLYEEVLATAENTSPSFHKRIRIAHVREYEYDSLLPVFDELAGMSARVEIPEMVKLMKKTVPEYKSQNSKFEEYDAK